MLKILPFVRALAYKAITRVAPSLRAYFGSGGYQRFPIGKDARFNSIVAACLGWIGRTASEPPLRLMERSEEGTYAPVDKHDALDLLAKPNTIYGWPAMLRSVMVDLSLFGNAYLVLKRNDRLMTEAIYWVSSLYMAPWRFAGGAAIQYYNCSDQYLSRECGARVLPEDVIHFRTGIDPDCPQLGWSPFRALLAEVFTDQQAAIWVANFLKNGAVPLMVISKGTPPPGRKTDWRTGDANIIRERFEDQARGDRIGSTVVMGRHLKVEKLGASAEDFDLTKLRLVPETRISGVFGVPPLLAGLLIGHQRANYANSSVARKLGAEQKIIPDMRDIAQTLSDRLLPEFEEAVYQDPESYRFEFDFSVMTALQEDQQKKSVRLNRLWNSNVIDRSEIRGAEGFSIREEDEGLYHADTRLGDLGSDPNPAQISALALLGLSAKRRPASQLKGMTRAQRRYLALRDARYVRMFSRYRREIAKLMEGVSTEIQPAITEALDAIEIPKGVKQDELTPEQAEAIDRIATQIATQLGAALTEANTRITKSGGGFYARVATDGLDELEIVIGRGIELSPQVEQSIVQRGGTRLGLVDFSADLRERTYRILAQGVGDGLGNPELARTIADRIPAGPWRTREIRSRVIARTETRYAQNYGTLKTCSELPDVQNVIVLDARIGDTDEECEALDGTTVTLAEAERLMDDEHPNGTRDFVPIVS